MQILRRLQMTRDQNAGHDSEYSFSSFLNLITTKPVQAWEGGLATAFGPCAPIAPFDDQISP
jgi:hypothetical protein